MANPKIRPGSLTNQTGISAQIRKIYREARNGDITVNEGKTLTWILNILSNQMISAANAEDFAERLAELEAKMKGTQ